MTKLWQKGGKRLHPIIEAYTVGDDWQLDQILLPYDVKASRVHAKMLCKIGVLSKKELLKVERGFNELEMMIKKGTLKIQIEDEDCHTVIENTLIKKIGEAGKKIHAGRSRNDQVLVALRLYMKDVLSQVAASASQLSKEFSGNAKKYQHISFPGYTHTQQAMLSNLGLYFGAFAEALGDDSTFIWGVKDHIDQNPLGSAAGYGVTLPLDRAFTTQALGFKKVQKNPMYCQNSRGKFESLAMEGLVQVMLTLSRFAADMLFFTSRECGFFSLSDAIVTGSSIMPQKRNLDPLEIVRANTSVVAAHHALIQNITIGLISGYNRDLQLIKKPLFESFSVVKKSLGVVSIILKNMQPDPDSIKNKIMPDIFAADIANDLVLKKNIPFREAYKRSLSRIIY